MLSFPIQSLYIKFQANWLKNDKVIHVFHFWAGKIVGWQAGWVVGWFDRINSVHMLSSSIQRLYIKFQPSLLKNIKARQVFLFWAGRLVRWQAGQAAQHVLMHLNHIHMLNPSIQRLHNKFQPNQLENAKYINVLLGWQAGWLVGWFDRIDSVHMLSSSIQRLNTKFQPNWLKNVQVMHVFHF